MKKRKALIIVDMQNDFMPGGSLAVNKANKLIKGINKLLNSKKFYIKVATKDWHPINHCSFIENGGIWPTHCVQNTFGSEIVKGIDLSKIDQIILKGTNPLVDSYSGFYEDKKIPTILNQILLNNKIEEVYIVGVALNVCVKATANDSKSLGFKTKIIRRLCKPIKSK